MLENFGVRNLQEFANLGAEGFENDYKERTKLFGNLALDVTDAALSGSHLAQWVCHKAAEEIVTGVRLIWACFESDAVPVALIGSVANSTFIKNAVSKTLSQGCNKKYNVTEPSLPPVLGAIIMALQLAKVEINEQIKGNLIKGSKVVEKQ